MKLPFFLERFFEICSNIKFHEKPSSLEPNCFIRTGRRDEAMVAFRNFVNAPNSTCNAMKNTNMVAFPTVLCLN